MFGFRLILISYLNKCGLAEVTTGVLKQCIYGTFCICSSQNTNLRESFVTSFCASKYSKSQGIQKMEGIRSGGEMILLIQLKELSLKL